MVLNPELLAIVRIAKKALFSPAFLAISSREENPPVEDLRDCQPNSEQVRPKIGKHIRSADTTRNIVRISFMYENGMHRRNAEETTARFQTLDEIETLLLPMAIFFCQRNFFWIVSHFCKKADDNDYSLGYGPVIKEAWSSNPCHSSRSSLGRMGS